MPAPSRSSSFPACLASSTLVASLTALALGCGDGGGADPTSLPTTPGGGGGASGASGGGAEADDPAAERGSAAINGFDLAPRAGDFWTFELDQTWQGKVDRAWVTMTLGSGASVTIDGVSARAFPVTYEVSGTGGYALVPEALAFGKGRIFAKKEGVWGVVFDAWNGQWPSSGGLFDSYRAGPMGASPVQWQGQSAYEVVQGGGNDCVTLPGYGTECGASDPYQAFSTTEYYAPGIGPLGEEYTGCSGGGCIDVVFRLVGWRVGDDAHAPPTSGNGGGGGGGGSASAGPPDLVVDAASVNFLPFDPDDDALYVCGGRDDSGAVVDDDSFVRFANVGAGPAGAFRASFALVDESAGHLAYALEDFTWGEPLPAGYDVTFEPDGCFTIPTSALPAGTYWVVLLVDAYDTIVESDESNNFAFWEATFVVR